MDRASLAALGGLAALAACMGSAADAQSETASDQPTPCADLAALALPDTTITAAEIVAPGAFSHPLQNGAQTATATPPDFSGLPEFCRVAATVSPTPTSAINFELWMP